MSVKDIFEIMTPKLDIPPKGTLDVSIRYIPNELDFQDTCEIVFESSKIGNWKFLLFGIGEKPTCFETVVLMGSLHKEGSGIVNFTNPFRSAISVGIAMKKNDISQDIFGIIQRKSKVTIMGQKTIQIPFTYYPKEIRDYTAEIIVDLNEKISWVYPLKIITESRS